MLKIMQLWNGNTFYFHSSQETRLLCKELSAKVLLLKAYDGNIAEYHNKDIPALWARTLFLSTEKDSAGKIPARLYYRIST